jgi:hypothetical protein
MIHRGSSNQNAPVESLTINSPRMEFRFFIFLPEYIPAPDAPETRAQNLRNSAETVRAHILTAVTQSFKGDHFVCQALGMFVIERKAGKHKPVLLQFFFGACCIIFI